MFEKQFVWQTKMNCGNVLNIFDEILWKSIEAIGKIIPNNFIDRYKEEFLLFCDLRKDNNANTLTEVVMLAFY